MYSIFLRGVQCPTGKASSFVHIFSFQLSMQLLNEKNSWRLSLWSLHTQPESDFQLMGKTKIQEKRWGNALKGGVFLWQIWHSLPCFLQTLACHTSAHCHGHSHKTNIRQSHAHNRPVVNGGMQRHVLTLAISLIEISSFPARTSILTPTFIMIKGSICPQASMEQFRSPKMVDEVTSCLHHPSPRMVKTLMQQLLNHCSLWANETHECASKHSAYIVVISSWFTSALVICAAEQCRELGRRTQ